MRSRDGLKGRFRPIRALAVGFTILGMRLAGRPAEAQQLSVLHTFTGGADGGNPFCSLIQDPLGNLYGTAAYGGDLNTNGGLGSGVLYKLDAQGNETVLYTFTDGTDGGGPLDRLLLDAQGNLYGTSQVGGTTNGTSDIFMLDPTGNFNVLYTTVGGTDGSYPAYALIQDAKGTLFGTTLQGGFDDVGVVFKVDLSGNETVLHTFTDTGGASPGFDGLIRDAQGNLYGTTTYGGASESGVVYKLDSTGHYSVLYDFTGGNDGANPAGGLLQDAQGNLYGTTFYGGVNGSGVVFKVNPAGNETVLYAFTGGSDGGEPYGGLIMDAQGNLYGVTGYGGINQDLLGSGVVYKLDPSGNETVLYTFINGADGAVPSHVLFQDAQGNLYGTTTQGGNRTVYTSIGAGVVFKLSPNSTGAVLRSLKLNSTIVKGGNPTVGKVTLSGPAPAGGAVVWLSSSNSSVVSVPTSVTIPSGKKSAKFPVTTTLVSKTQHIKIFASYAGPFKTASLAVKK